MYATIEREGDSKLYINICMDGKTVFNFSIQSYRPMVIPPHNL